MVFSAPDGTIFEVRVLTVEINDQDIYNRYKVIREIPNVKEGPSIQWFAQDGGCTQFQFPYSMNVLLNAIIPNTGLLYPYIQIIN